MYTPTQCSRDYVRTGSKQYRSSINTGQRARFGLLVDAPRSPRRRIGHGMHKSNTNDTSLCRFLSALNLPYRR
jgi:hypothetical protein